MMSPPFHEFPENTLRDGDEMASELFPVIA
jgi:hypothetical protein